MNVGELVPDGVGLFLNFFPFNKDIIKLIFEFFVLSFDVGVRILDIFGSGIDSDFIQSDVVVGEGSFEVTNFFN